MALKVIPARTAWVGVGAWAPAWAAMLKPIVSAIMAMLSTAVVQRRTRRVIVTSSISVHPVLGDHRRFDTAPAPDWYARGRPGGATQRRHSHGGQAGGTRRRPAFPRRR